MRYFQRNDRAGLFLALVGVLMVASVSVQSQQTHRRQTPARKCTLPEEELDSLMNLLEDIEQEPQPESDEGSEESDEAVESLSPQLDPLCTRELKRLRHTVNHLQRSYLELKQIPVTITERDYKILDYRYNQHKKQLTARLEELTKQIKPQHRSQLAELRRKIVAVEIQLTKTVSKVAEQRQQNVNHFIQLVANNIYDQRINDAMKNFNTLVTYNSDPYGEIVQKLFQQRGKTYTADAMLSFLKRVDMKHRPVLGYDALVDAMIAHSTLYGPEAVELLKHIQCLILARDGNQQPQALALMKKFKSNAH